MNRVLACILSVLLATVALAPAASAVDQRVTYQHATGDLYPNDDRVDVSLTVTGNATWSLEEGALTVNDTHDRWLDPEGEDLTFTIDYTLQPRCCPNAHRDGTKVYVTDMVIGTQTIGPIPLDEDWEAELTLHGSLRSQHDTVNGDAVITPETHAWKQDWASKTITFDVTHGDTNGDVHATIPTEYHLRLEITVRHTNSNYEASGDAWEDDLPGTPSITHTYPVNDGDTSTTTQDPTHSEETQDASNQQDSPPTTSDEASQDASSSQDAVPSVSTVTLLLAATVTALAAATRNT